MVRQHAGNSQNSDPGNNSIITRHFLVMQRKFQPAYNQELVTVTFKKCKEYT